MRHGSKAFAISLPVVRARLQRSVPTGRGRHYVARRTIACTQPAAHNTDVRIRRATEDDIPTACRILTSAFSEELLGQDFPKGVMPLLVPLVVPLYEAVTRLDIGKQLERRIGNEQHAILLAEINETAVGCAEVGVLDIGTLTKGGDGVRQWGRGGGEAYVGNVGVVRAWRGKGVGRKLVESAKGTAEDWGLGCVWLCVEAGNGGAVEFYKRLGFGCVAQEPVWFDEVGRKRRLFLCSGKGEEVGQWGKAKIVAGKLSVWHYLRYCYWDLQRRASLREEHNP